MQFMVQGAWGVIPAHISELSQDAVRGFLPGFAYQCGVLLASLVVYLEALFAARTSYATSMAMTAAMVLVLAIIVTALGPERRGIAFGARPEPAAARTTSSPAVVPAATSSRTCLVTCHRGGMHRVEEATLRAVEPLTTTTPSIVAVARTD